MGWNYALGWLCTLPFELTAASITIQVNICISSPIHFHSVSLAPFAFFFLCIVSDPRIKDHFPSVNSLPPFVSPDLGYSYPGKAHGFFGLEVHVGVLHTSHWFGRCLGNAPLSAYMCYAR